MNLKGNTKSAILVVTYGGGTCLRHGKQAPHMLRLGVMPGTIKFQKKIVYFWLILNQNESSRPKI